MDIHKKITSIILKVEELNDRNNHCVVPKPVLGELKKLETLPESCDHKLWAKEFCKICNEIYKIDIDREWMEAWFANAILAGHERGVNSK